MTGPQVKEQLNKLNKKYYGDKCRIPENLIKPISRRDAIAFKKLQIVEMMISNLTYGSDYFDMVESSWYVRNARGRFDWDDLEDLGIKDGRAYVRRLWICTQSDFKAYATVMKGVYEDNEGVSYNGLVWRK